MSLPQGLLPVMQLPNKMFPTKGRKKIRGRGININ